MNIYDVPPLPPEAMAEVPDDLTRITRLDQREVVDCERLHDGTRRWTPEAQALISFVTAKYIRPPRLSCGCRGRHVEVRADGITVFQEGPPGQPPMAPVFMTKQLFEQDNNHDPLAVKKVLALGSGESVFLKGLGHPFCITELNPVQSWTLWEAPRVGGTFGMISVGGGKSFLGILLPLSMPHLRTWVILIKPDQRMHYVNSYLRLREHFRVPSIVFDDARGSIIVPSTPVLRVVPYSTLSNPKSTQMLEGYDPDGIIADESHLLAAKSSSRTMRFLRFMTKRNAEGRSVHFFNWSGSTVKKSVKDCAHLAAHSLGLGSPYPILPDVVEDWSVVMDPSNMPDYTSTTAKNLRRAFGRQVSAGVPEAFLSGMDFGIREGHRDRVIRTPGVISTKSSSISCSITIRERKAPKMPEVVRKALRGVRGSLLDEEPQRPDGDIITETVEQARIAREVCSGHFGYWKFRKEDSDELILEWYACRKAWNREVRAKLLQGEPHMDSHMLCEHAAERAWRVPLYEGDLPVWPAVSWPAWVAIRDRVTYEERVRWIGHDLPEAADPATHPGYFLARDAAAWAQDNIGVVWCQSRALGMKIAELAKLPYHGGGPEAEAKILSEDGSRSVIASIKAHGTGRDGLQFHFHKQLLPESPSSGDMYEQVLGRLAREGQREDTVETEIYRHTGELREAFRKALMYAEFIEATTPNKQALLAADINFDVDEEGDA